MSISYAIGYKLPTGRWFTKNCENDAGGEYIRKLLKRGINDFFVDVWCGSARRIEMSHFVGDDGKISKKVFRDYPYYRTQMGNINEYKINGYHFIEIDGQYHSKSC